MRRRVCEKFAFVTTLLAIGAASTAAMSAELAAKAPPAQDDCKMYDKYMVRNRNIPVLLMCDTVNPELGGFRKFLYDNGLMYFSTVSFTGGIDMKNATTQVPQIYNGQRWNVAGNTTQYLTYDLSRLGLGSGQLVMAGTYSWSTYRPIGMNGGWFNQLTLEHEFFDGQVAIQYGFARLSDSFHGDAIGASAASTPSGPQGSLMVELGMAVQPPTPEFDIKIKTPDLRFYNHFGVARSVHPDGYIADAEYNPIGLNVNGVPGAGALLVDEVGYRRSASPTEKALWVRAGGVYNTSNYFDYAKGMRSEGNNGFYVLADAQLTQVDPTGRSFRGLYGAVAFDNAAPEKNIFNRSLSASLYFLGPFSWRPFDSVSVGYLHQWVSSDYAAYTLQTRGLQAISGSDTISVSYTARLGSGVYWTNGLQYSSNPVVAPAHPWTFAYSTRVFLAF